MIDAAAAVEEAKRAMGATAGKPGMPLLVERIDQSGGDYYLVPWEAAAGVIGVVQVDASSGKTAASATFPVREHLLMTPEEAAKSAERLGATVAGEPRLVWRPCREAASALLPLYAVPTREEEVFVDVAGRVFRSLTPFGLGG